MCQPILAWYHLDASWKQTLHFPIEAYTSQKIHLFPFTMMQRIINLHENIAGWNMATTNILRQRQNDRHFADNIFKCISLNENAWILHEISLKFAPNVRINNIPALFQIMAWRRPGDKPLPEPMMLILLTHIWTSKSVQFNLNLLDYSNASDIGVE